MSTYQPIATQTLASSASSITFAAIPQTYTDLVLVSRGTLTGSAVKLIRLNGDTSSIYGCVTMTSDGGSTSTGFYSEPYIDVVNASTNQFVNVTNLNNYSNSVTYKSYLTRQGAATTSTELIVGTYRRTDPVYSITLTTSSNAFAAGCTFNLYGISALSSEKATGGNIITTDGTYWYHAFTSTGVFTPISSLTADVLSIGGGGAGGRGGGGGGGGGGGELDYTNQSLTAQAYTVTIGAGGSAGSPYSPTNGNTTSFSSLVTSLGGGRGASGSQTAGNGGSGGGGGNDYPTAGTASGSNTFAGGAGYTGGAPYNGAGGGGATAVGAAGTSGSGGNGGAGYTLSSIYPYLTTLLSPMTVVASGGGGAVQNGTGQNTQPGTGGTGAGNGGGSGGSYTGAVNATASSSYGSGGGGSAGANAGNPSSGYQGVVIIRYAV